MSEAKKFQLSRVRIPAQDKRDGRNHSVRNCGSTVICAGRSYADLFGSKKTIQVLGSGRT